MAVTLGDALANAKTVRLDTLQVGLYVFQLFSPWGQLAAVPLLRGRQIHMAQPSATIDLINLKTEHNRSICTTAAAGDGAVARQRPSAAPGGGGGRYRGRRSRRRGRAVDVAVAHREQERGAGRRGDQTDSRLAELQVRKQRQRVPSPSFRCFSSGEARIVVLEMSFVMMIHLDSLHRGAPDANHRVGVGVYRCCVFCLPGGPASLSCICRWRATAWATREPSR